MAGDRAARRARRKPGRVRSRPALTDGERAGITLGSAEAIDQLAKRRASVLPWLVDDGAMIFDAFAGFLAAQNAWQFRIYLAEWVDAANSEAEARAELRAMLDALDTLRRPRPFRPSAAPSSPNGFPFILTAAGGIEMHSVGVELARAAT